MKNENKKEIITVKTFNEYVLMQYHCRAKQLEECIKVLCNELPRTLIPYTIFKCMNIAIDLMKVFKNFLISARASNVGLKKLFKSKVEECNEMLLCVDRSYSRHLSRKFNLHKAYDPANEHMGCEIKDYINQHTSFKDLIEHFTNRKFK
ncbi:hypothetical protein KFK09_008654 [Dendrobium nobile]|uniref:Uncharacterized protein n=1 Tax=Dendrobium nobile TaxID=94219 RepID=A0A8T3BRF9_DENNO|nr:hypothetical protein KFK09_008654 [Dendrobium nobile]